MKNFEIKNLLEESKSVYLDKRRTLTDTQVQSILPTSRSSHDPAFRWRLSVYVRDILNFRENLRKRGVNKEQFCNLDVAQWRSEFLVKDGSSGISLCLENIKYLTLR